MKLVIISDLHDNLVNLNKCLAWCNTQGIKTMLFVGDLTNSETLEYLSTNFSEQIYLVRGNACNYDDKLVKKYSNLTYLGRDGGIVVIENHRIGLCHEPFLIDQLLLQTPEMVFYGHTHKPWEESRNGVRLVNPGTLGGMFQKATFAVYNTANQELELKILETL